MYIICHLLSLHVLVISISARTTINEATSFVLCFTCNAYWYSGILRLSEKPCVFRSFRRSATIGGQQSELDSITNLAMVGRQLGDLGDL